MDRVTATFFSNRLMQQAFRRTALLVAALPAAIGTLGCYAYLPARDAGALQGKRASFALTDSGSVVLAPRIGPSIVAIEGRYAGDSAGVYLVDMLVTRQRNGAEADWHGERVAVARPLVASLEQREFSAPRSFLAGALAAIGVAAITAAIRGKGDNGTLGSGTGGKPVPQ
jgi:hypothetical protein